MSAISEGTVYEGDRDGVSSWVGGRGEGARLTWTGLGDATREGDLAKVLRDRTAVAGVRGGFWGKIDRGGVFSRDVAVDGVSDSLSLARRFASPGVTASLCA